MTEDMLARFIVEDPELTNTVVSTAKAYLRKETCDDGR